MKQFANDMQLLGRIRETTDIIYRLEQQKRKLVIKYKYYVYPFGSPHQEV